MRNKFPFPYPKIQGSALIMMLILLGLAVALLVSALKSNPQIERDKITADVMTQAKDALVGYAVTYRENNTSHADDVWGYLPCPDWPGGTLPEGSETGTCASASFNVLGRLPWYTLGLPPLRDSTGECLWYGVSGRFKGGSSKTSPLNWDTAGQIDMMSEDGSTIRISNAVAVILAPGIHLPAQDRSSVAGTSSCGGNYDARNYLDPYDAGNAIAGVANYFPGSTNNLTAADSANKKLIQPTASAYYNDRLLVITADDIFNKVRLRSDFKAAIDTLVSDFATCLHGMASLPATSASNKGMDNVLVSCPAPANAAKANFYNNWKDNLLYAKPGGSIAVNGSTCDAVLIFGGARTGAQVRISTTDKGNAINYLEGSNATSFPNGTTYSGASTYSKTSPSYDIVACITAAPSSGPTVIEFSNTTEFSKFVPAGDTSFLQIYIDPNNSANNYATLLSGSATNKAVCFWYPTASTLSGKTLRAYFNFLIANIDTSATSSSEGDGFTFALIPGDSDTTVCGSATGLGFAGGTVPAPNIAVETDTYYSSGNNDPATKANHVAVLSNAAGTGANNFLAHPAGSVSTACNGTLDGCAVTKVSGQPNWLENGTQHNQRIELRTGCDATCSTCGGSGTRALVKVWIDCANCTDVTANYAITPPKATLCTTLPSEMSAVKFGFTAGAGASRHQDFSISNFKLGLD